MRAPHFEVPHPGPKTRAQLEKIRRGEAAAGLSFGLGADAIVAERAAGAVIEDVDGNRFLDFVAGFGSLNTGHSHPRVVEAIRVQSEKIQQAMSFVSKTRAELMEKVLSLVPGPTPKKMIFGATGSEAAEMAIKMARRYTGKQEIVAFSGAFHGRTMGALPFMGRKNQRAGIGPLVPGTRHVPFPYPYRNPFSREPAACVDGVLNLLEEYLVNPASGWGEVAAVMIEPVQGNGGFIPAPIGFLEKLRALCDRHGALLIIDEVMSGFCRTGKMFAAEYEPGVEADLMVLGKSLSSGLPLSACVAKAEIAAASPPFTESSTYSGNVVSCAAALAAIEVYETEGLADRAARMGAYFMGRLGELAERHPAVGEVRGRGLMIGVELVADRESRAPLAVAKAASEAALARGLLLYPGGHYGNVLGFLPPLIIDEKDVDAAVGILDDVLLEVSKAG